MLNLGSSNYITNIAGEVSQHTEYFAFGETFVEEHKGSNNSPYKFNGKELDEESGLYYYGARYYDPRISIWASVDPLAEISPNVSPYVYCLNNPVNMVDPDGRKERANDYDGKMDKGDWRKSDREDNTDVWKKANAHNLQQKKGSKEYVNIEQRAAFYSWYQGASDEKGNNTRWAGAAAKVASAINEMANPKFIGMNVSLIADYLSFSSDEARAFANEGNEKIFEDAFPKLKNAFNGPQISGSNGKLWDANMLSQEQNLIQPLYENTSAIGLLSAASKQLLIGSKFLAKIKGIDIKPFPTEGCLSNASERWAYGMQGMGYNVKPSDMPNPGVGYTDGSILKNLK